MMKKYALYLLLIFSLAINITAAGTLIYHHCSESRFGSKLLCGQKPFGRLMREELQIEQEDILRLQSLFAQDKEELLNLKKGIRQQRQILFDLLGKPEIDHEQIDRQIEKIADLQAQMEKKVARGIIRMKSGLSEENQRKILKILRQRSGFGPFSQGSFSPAFWKKGGRW